MISCLVAAAACASKEKMLSVPRAASRFFCTSAAALQKAALQAAATAPVSSTRIHSIKENPLEKSVEVQWTDGARGEFSYIWLRDSAPGSPRKAYISELNLDVKPESLTVADTGEELVIHWPPYKLSSYGSDFLRKYSVGTQEESEELGEKINGSIVQWNRSTVKIANPTREEFLKNPGETVEHFEKFGIVCIKNCTQQDRKGLEWSPVVDEIMAKFLSENSVTKTECSLYNVKERADSLHVYGPHYKNTPRYVGMLFLENADSQFQLADGFKIGTVLKRRNPELFDVLENTDVSYNDPEGKATTQHPVFTTDAYGKEIVQVLFNNSQRSIQGSLSTVQSEVVYKAIKAFHGECYKAENVIQMQISQGDLLLLNNKRILYGHSAFTRPCNVLVTCYT